MNPDPSIPCLKENGRPVLSTLQKDIRSTEFGMVAPFFRPFLGEQKWTAQTE